MVNTSTSRNRAHLWNAVVNELFPAPAVPTTNNTGGEVVSCTAMIPAVGLPFFNPRTGPIECLIQSISGSYRVLAGWQSLYGSQRWAGYPQRIAIELNEMSDDMPPPPPGLPPAPPGMEMPPAPPGMDAPPAPPGMDLPPPPQMDAPPAPPAPPGMDLPPPPPMDAPPGMEAPPAPPEMDAPPAPPGMDLPPPPPMDAPPEMDAPPAPPGMDLPPPPPMDDSEAVEDEEAPPAPPGMDLPPPPPMDAPPEMDAPPAPPGMDLLSAPPPPPPMDAPPEMDAPPAPPGMDLLSAPPPPPPEIDLLAPPAAPEAAALDPLAPVEDAPPETPSLDLLSGGIDEVGAEFDEETTPPSRHAGGTLRTTDVVDDIQGDKIRASLSENEDALLTSDGDIVRQKVKGVMTLHNPSSEDRLWDIDVFLAETGSTDFKGEHMPVAELEPDTDHSVDYKVKNARMLILRERIDTNPSRSQERSLSVSHDSEATAIALEIEVENVSSVQVDDVLVTRNIPDPIEITSGAEVEGSTLTWNVGSLNAGEVRTLTCEANVLVTDIKPVNAGTAKATYSADATLSSVHFSEVDAFCRGFSYMVVDEDERPDNWRCQAVFENRSSFVVDLVKLQVRVSGSEELLFDVADVSEDVAPQGKWESETKEVAANERPDFTNELGYSVIPRVEHMTSGSIELEPQTFTILEAEVTKTYDAATLRSYREQVVNACMSIKNTGSSDINLMRITDDVPGLFTVPTADALTISIDGERMSSEQFRVEVKEGVTLEEFRRSPDGDGCTLQLTVGTRGPIGLKAGSTMDIEYALTAPDPSPANEEVAAPARTEFSAERFGPVCARDAAESPVIKVSHKRRKFSAGKTVIPIGGKGRFEVLIIFENRSDTALQDLVIHDVLPVGFEIKDCVVKGAGNEKRSDVEMKTDSNDDGTSVEWHVPVIAKDEKMEVSYEIKGDGDIDAEAMQKFHGATFGDEVEDDSSLASMPSDDSTDDSDDSSEESGEDAASDFSWNENVLAKVMEAHGIDDRDAFIAHAINFDADDNNYLNKGELTAAAEAWGSDEGDADDSDADDEGSDSDDGGDFGDTENVEEDSGEDDASDDAGDSEGDDASEGDDETVAEETAADGPLICGICTTQNPAGSATCNTCGFVFS